MLIDEALASRCGELTRIAAAKGQAKQTEKLVEELAELIVSITHLDKPNESPAVKRVNFCEEFADVLILMEQFKQSFLDADYTAQIVSTIHFKIDRELARLPRR